jgi:hypothetical protein
MPTNTRWCTQAQVQHGDQSRQDLRKELQAAQAAAERMAGEKAAAQEAACSAREEAEAAQAALEVAARWLPAQPGWRLRV